MPTEGSRPLLPVAMSDSMTLHSSTHFILRKPPIPGCGMRRIWVLTADRGRRPRRNAHITHTLLTLVFCCAGHEEPRQA